jgi:hypothetical protein
MWWTMKEHGAGDAGEREQQPNHVADVADDVERQHAPPDRPARGAEHAHHHRETGDGRTALRALLRRTGTATSGNG